MEFGGDLMAAHTWQVLCGCLQLLAHGESTKRQWLCQQLRVTAIAHSIILLYPSQQKFTCFFIINHQALPPNNAQLIKHKGSQYIHNSCCMLMQALMVQKSKQKEGGRMTSNRQEWIKSGHLRDRFRLIFSFLVILIDFTIFSYDCRLVRKIQSGINDSFYIRSITVNLADEGGTTDWRNWCLFSLEQSDTPSSSFIDRLVILERRSLPAILVLANAPFPSMLLPLYGVSLYGVSHHLVSFSSSPVPVKLCSGCGVTFPQQLCFFLQGRVVFNSSGSMWMSGTQQLPILKYNNSHNWINTLQTSQKNKRYQCLRLFFESEERMVVQAWKDRGSDILLIMIKLIKQSLQRVFLAFGCSGHAFVDGGNKSMECLVGFAHQKNVVVLGLFDKAHEFLLFSGQEDVVGQGSDQLFPNLSIPFREGLYFSAHCIENAISDTLYGYLAQRQQHFGQNVVHLVSQLLLQLLVEGQVFRIEPECLIIAVLVVGVDEFARPIHHEDGLKEGVSSPHHSGSFTAEVLQALVQQEGQLSTLQHN